MSCCPWLASTWQHCLSGMRSSQHVSCNWTRCPSLLVQPCFSNNPQDAQALQVCSACHKCCYSAALARVSDMQSHSMSAATGQGAQACWCSLASATTLRMYGHSRCVQHVQLVDALLQQKSSRCMGTTRLFNTSQMPSACLLTMCAK